jgi:hypothetical protein
MGSKEQIMANQSLARIMYGTNEDLHASTSTSASDLPGLPAPSITENSNNSEPGEETLGELLHRVWINVSGKH